MKSQLFRRACASLVLCSALGVTASAFANTHSAKADDTTQLCASCINFGVYAWRFTPGAGVDVANLFDTSPDISIKNAPAGMKKLSTAARPAEVQRLLRQSGHAEPVLNFYSVTTAGHPLPLSTGGADGEFSAVLTPEARTANTPDLINFELHSEVPQGGFTRGISAYSKGSFLLKDGSASLILQKVSGAYVVWMITAGPSV